MTFKRVYFFIFLLSLSFRLIAEGSPDTTIYLNEVNINSNITQNFSSGNKLQSLPKKTIEAYQNSNLLSILSDQSMVNIKTYGISGLSNISIRGSQTNQTAVVWNGINLQDPLNGSVNPSLFPVGLIDKIEIQYGGSGALYGSGAVGGVIMMKKIMNFNTGFGVDFSVGIGSFENYQGQIKIRYGGEKYSGSLIYYHSQAENNFPYINTQAFGHPKVKQENAANNVDGVSQDNSFILNENQKINTHFWYQKSHREIAPNTTIHDAHQFQNDEAMRFSGDWIKYGKKTSLMARLGLIHSILDYNDPGIALQAIHQSTSIIAQFESNIQLNKLQLINWGVNNRFDMGKSDNFPDHTQRNTLAFFLSYKLQLLTKKLNIVTSIREELIEDSFGSPTPSIGIDYNPFNYLSIKGKVSRNYRSPTFNDLFWQGGFAHGNTELLPESGWSQEIGIDIKTNGEPFKPSLQITAFNSHINNLIVWTPEDNIWSPVNQKKVWSRGIEIQELNEVDLNDAKTGLNLYYTYNPSTLESGDNSGKQLIYQPINQVKAKYYFNYKSWTLDIIYQWFDERFIYEDNSKSLDSYQLVNIAVHGDVPIKKHLFVLQFRVNNIFDEIYQSVENYAYPLRNFQFSIQYKFN